jgi:SAM-dependent methyltransferase
MLPESLARLLDLPERARVLDVGGWAAPVNRADWVIDLMPFESRGVLLPDGFGPGPERFDRDRWVIADLCASTPWPFEDDFFDFAICTFTLEDVRDPIRVCEEMSRVARAGYIEVPSLLDELSWRNVEPSGGDWVGHCHHRWLCTLQDDELVFLPKWHSLHSRPSLRVPARWAHRLSAQDRVLAHFWEGSLPARERQVIGDYPYAELRRVVEQRFGTSFGARLQLRSRAFAERARAAGRWRLGGLRRQLAGRGAR